MENSLKVEDEMHFVLVCPLFKKERLDMLQIIFRKFPNTELLTNENLFFWIMSQEQYELIKLLGKFCTKAFNARKRYLNNPSD